MGEQVEQRSLRPDTDAVISEGFPELLARAQSGDAEAFARLWVDLNPRLVRFLRLESPNDAEDLAAETWTSVVKGLRRFRGDEVAWRAWVFTTARRRAIDAARRRSRRVKEVQAGQAPDFVAPDVTDSVVDTLSPGHAVQLLALLPPLQAEVLGLRVIADLPVETVAAMLGRSPGAVRVATHRGLRRLAQELRNQGVTR